MPIRPITPGDVTRAENLFEGLLIDSCDIYRPDINGALPASPTIEDVPCFVISIARLTGPEAPTGEQEQMPMRSEIRFSVSADVEARDRLRVTLNRKVVQVQNYEVQAVRDSTWGPLLAVDAEIRA